MQMLKSKVDTEPLINYLNRFLSTRPPGDLSSICEKSWVISPEEKSYFPPAICTKTYKDFNLKTVNGISLEEEVCRVSGGHVTHSATIAYQINQAKLLSGILYKNNFKLKLTSNKESKLNFYGSKASYTEGLLVSSWSSNQYFGHWIKDECPKILTANEMGIQAISSGSKFYSHRAGYEAIFNLTSVSVERAVFERLIVLSRENLNRYRRQRLCQLRELVVSKTQTTAGNQYVYLKRGNTGAAGRGLSNEDQLVEKLLEYGFVIIEPEKLTVDEILQQCVHATIIMGVEGSAMIHAFLSLKGSGAMLCLVPEYRFNNPYANYCAAVGLNYGFIVGKTSPGGFEVDLGDVQDVLELVVKSNRA